MIVSYDTVLGYTGMIVFQLTEWIDKRILIFSKCFCYGFISCMLGFSYNAIFSYNALSTMHEIPSELHL